MQRPKFPVHVFFDGSCSVCAAKIEYYLHRNRDGRLAAVDVSRPDFDPKQFGISQADFMQQLHVIDSQGRVFRGVEAFWAIWQAFPASNLYGFLGTLIMLPGFNAVARLIYKGFASIRRYFPKHGGACVNDNCRKDRERRI